MELGCYNAGFTYTLREYFKNAKNIVSVDIDPYCKQFEDKSKNVFVEIGDQCDINFLIKINEKYGPIDICIDDSGHENHQIITSLKTLFPLLSNNGVYIVEDTFCCYDKNWDSDRDKDTYGNNTNIIHGDNSFSAMEYLKSMADKLHCYTDKNKTIFDEFEKDLFSIHFYDGICFLHKFSRDKNMKFGYSKFWGHGERIEM